MSQASVPPTYQDRSRGLTLEQMMAGPPIRETRAKHAFELPSAAEFSKDRKMRLASWLIGEIKQCPEIWDELEEGTTDPQTYAKRHTGVKHGVGRDRMPGHWGLIGAAWIISKQPDMQVFTDNLEDSVWKAAGFTWPERPCYSTAHERIVELTHYKDAYDRATSKLWHLAMHLDPKVFRHIHVDGTAAEAHARIEHACEDPVWCAANGGGDMPRWIDKLDVGSANKLRQEENKLPAEDDEAETNEAKPFDVLAAIEADEGDPWDAIDLEEAVLGELESGESIIRHVKYDLRSKRKKAAVTEDGRKELWIAREKNGKAKHRYLTRDLDCGFRIYTDSRTGRRIKMWLGYLKLRAVDDYTGAEVTSIHIAANEVEHKHVMRLIERVKDITGLYPEAVTTDKGGSVRAVRRACNEMGIALIAPFKAPNNQIKDRSQMRKPGDYDEYGFSYCRHCGSAGTRLGFSMKRGKAYQTFYCSNPHPQTRAKCMKQQSRALDDEPLVLGVVGRDSELYFELRDQGKPFEKSHRNGRTRYGTAANNVDMRPKRIGIEFLELRSCISHFVEVFRLCLRNGWIGNHPTRNTSQPRQRSGGKEAVTILELTRRAAGLLLPAGPKAEKLGLVFQGILPTNWVPISIRRDEAKATRRGKKGVKATAEEKAAASQAAAAAS